MSKEDERNVMRPVSTAVQRPAGVTAPAPISVVETTEFSNRLKDT